jgi:hypothetical protein
MALHEIWGGRCPESSGIRPPHVLNTVPGRSLQDYVEDKSSKAKMSDHSIPRRYVVVIVD